MGNKDTKLRLALTNKYLLKRHIDSYPTCTLTDPDALERRHREEKFIRQDPTTVSYTQMHSFNSGNEGMNCKECLTTCCLENCERNCKRCVTCVCFDDAIQAYFLTILGPYDVLSALFTVWFPIICIAITP
eukprot:UN28206